MEIAITGGGATPALSTIYIAMVRPVLHDIMMLTDAMLTGEILAADGMNKFIQIGPCDRERCLLFVRCWHLP